MFHNFSFVICFLISIKFWFILLSVLTTCIINYHVLCCHNTRVLMERSYGMKCCLLFYVYVECFSLRAFPLPMPILPHSIYCFGMISCKHVLHFSCAHYLVSRKLFFYITVFFLIITLSIMFPTCVKKALCPMLLLHLPNLCFQNINASCA